MFYGLTGISIRFPSPRYDIASIVDEKFDSWSDATSWPEPFPDDDLDNPSNRSAYPDRVTHDNEY